MRIEPPTLVGILDRMEARRLDSPRQRQKRPPQKTGRSHLSRQARLDQNRRRRQAHPHRGARGMSAPNSPNSRSSSPLSRPICQAATDQRNRRLNPKVPNSKSLNLKSRNENRRHPSHCRRRLNAIAALLLRPTAPKGPPGKGGLGARRRLKCWSPPPRRIIAEPRSFVGTVKPIRRSLVGGAAAGRVEEYLDQRRRRRQSRPAHRSPPPRHHSGEVNAAKANLVMRQAELGRNGEVVIRRKSTRPRPTSTTPRPSSHFARPRWNAPARWAPPSPANCFEEDSSLAYPRPSASVREHQAALRMLTQGARQMKTEQARARVAAQPGRAVQRLRRAIRPPHHEGALRRLGLRRAHRNRPVGHARRPRRRNRRARNEVDVEIAVRRGFRCQSGYLGRRTRRGPRPPAEKFTGRVAIINPQADGAPTPSPSKSASPIASKTTSPCSKPACSPASRSRASKSLPSLSPKTPSSSAG